MTVTQDHVRNHGLRVAAESLGQTQYTRMNQLMSQTFARQRQVIVAHRGVSSGMVPENTKASTTAAVRSGADMVEIDVNASKDGVYYAFHEGTEQENLGLDVALEDLSSTEIDRLTYRVRGRGGRGRPIERVEDVLGAFKGSDLLFNVDRSWEYWPQFLRRLDALDMAPQLLLKCPADQVGSIAALRAHDTAYPFMAICRTEADVAAALELDGVNLVGLELIAKTSGHGLHDSDLIRQIHEQSLFTFVNAEMLGDDDDLFAGLDDEKSLDEDPDLGWGVLMDLGFDAIQTDWPWLLRDYREQRGGGSSR